MRNWRALPVIVMALAFAGACGSFGADTPPDPEDSGSSTTDGGGGADGPGPGPTDGPTPIDDDASGDATLPDSAITSFGSACKTGDFTEVEANDVAATANVFTKAACGEVSTVVDVDHFKIDVGAGRVRVAWATEGNATINIVGPGGNETIGGNTGGGYKLRMFDAPSPGTYKINFKSSSEAPQRYRVLVVQ